MFTDLIPNQANKIRFAMIDASGAEVAGLGGTYTLQICKPTAAAFVASSGAKAEVAGGIYEYTLTAAECDTAGQVAIIVTAPGCQQQNLVYNVGLAVPGAIEYTYTVTDSVTLLPVEGVAVWFTTDTAGSHTVWSGITDAFGVARDNAGRKPLLDAGNYRAWEQKTGYAQSFTDVVVS